MRITSLICCESIIRDAETGQITAYNVLDDITAVGFPILIPKFSIYFFSHREPDEPESLEVKLSIICNGKPLFNQQFKANFKSKLKNKSIILIKGIVVGEPSSLVVKVETLDSQSLYEKEISVTSTPKIEVS
jgi:hypothetical protein